MELPNSTKGSVLALLFLVVFLTVPFYFSKLKYKAATVAVAAIQDDKGVKTPTRDTGKGVTITLTPSPTPAYTSEQEEIVAYIHEVFGKDAGDALKIVGCENHAMIPDRVGYNSNGSTDIGIFQINSIHAINPNYLKDWRVNVDVAYKMFREQGWSPWVCYWKYNATGK